MDVVYEIQNAQNDEEIKKIIDRRIKEETKKSIKDNDGETIIGPKLEINPEFHFLRYEDEKIFQDNEGFYLGFIPKGTKLVYGILTNYDCLSQYSSGYYYYIDDFSYIYEFAKFIKTQDVKDEYDLIPLVYAFLRDYYDNILNPKNRRNLHKLILKDEYFSFIPTKEHSNADFINTNAALCSEFASAAQNILNVMGIYSIYIQDFDHAYNIICLQDKNIIDYYIFDCAKRMVAYNLSDNNYSETPFIEYIKDFDEEQLYELLQSKRKVKAQLYTILKVGNKYFRYYLNSYEEYGILNDYQFDIDTIKLKLEHKK